jgi:hypothetical protein
MHNRISGMKNAEQTLTPFWLKYLKRHRLVLSVPAGSHITFGRTKGADEFWIFQGPYQARNAPESPVESSSSPVLQRVPLV